MALYGILVLESADGTVHPIYTRENSVWLGVNAPTQMTGSYGIDQYASCVTCTSDVTTYYHDDQIGSSRIMTGVGGWPVWQGTFLPYGEEYNPQITTNHFKFTGKERDTESGLDYFGARYYSNGLGRFITPDWAAKAAAVPYAEFADPQTLNLYAHVRNVPTSLVGGDGHSMGALSNEGFEGFESFWGVAKKKNEKSTSKNPNPGANDLGISIIKTKTGRYTKGLAVSWSWPVKMNKRMSELLTRLEIPADLSHDIHPRALLATADFVTVDGSVLLRSEHEKNRHVKAPDFPDRTGFECFVNHLHLPFNGTRESLLGSLGYAIALRHALSSFEGKNFLVIASVADCECTVRFHQVRQNESWVSEDLERYGSEAILLLNSRAPA